MYIQKVKIQNFKGYKELDLALNTGMNIIVGDNEARKTTILEAINLALTGYLDGKYLTVESLNDYLFNKEVVDKFKSEIESGTRPEPPSIIIELHFSDDASSEFEGGETISSEKSKGLYYRIGLRQEFQKDYNKLNKDELKSLPLEFYKIELKSFSGSEQVRSKLPIKNAFIDTSSNFQNVSDQTIARIIKSELDENEVIKVSQFYRGIKEQYKGHSIHQELNKHLKYEDASISIDPSSKNSWDNHLSVYVKDIPFSYIGKGIQTILKTHVSLTSKKSDKASLILIEEPENHLSHASLNELISYIQNNCMDKQIIITSHNSFVANKLGLGTLILLNGGNPLPFNDLKSDTKEFFKKLPGYDTLRLLLCKKAILVEGDADELVVQRAYMDLYEGKLPISKGIDVISVNNTYGRFLEIAQKLNISLSLVMDTDNRLESRKALKKEFELSSSIDVFFEENDLYTGAIENYNNNTLEPLLLKYNSLTVLNDIFDTSFETADELLKYMKDNKTTCALKIFESPIKINYPKYINDAISFVLSYEE